MGFILILVAYGEYTLFKNTFQNLILAALVHRLSFCMGGLRSSGMLIPSRKSTDITKIISRKGLYNCYYTIVTNHSNPHRNPGDQPLHNWNQKQ